MQIRVRVAPSPTGSPHVGTLRTAIFNWLLARKHDGAFVARLEDTDRDPARYKPEAIGEIEECLRWAGVEPDEWWAGGGGRGPYVQSERLPLYQSAAADLIERGAAYRCWCTEQRLTEMRDAQQASGRPTGYDRRCRALSAAERSALEASGAPFTVRLATPLEGTTTYRDLVYGEVTFDNRNIDDQVLLKSNGWPTYHLGVVVDDHLMGITHVLRGEEWMPSTPKQVLLYAALGWAPPAWVHLPLIIGADRKKLGKRHGSTQIGQFIKDGYLPEALFNFLLLLGWSAGDENRELFTRAEVLERFDIGGITNHPAVFDYEKLRWMNGEYIRKADPVRITRLCLPFLAAAGLVSDPPTEEERARAAKVVPLAADRLRVLAELPPMVDFFFRAPAAPEEKGQRKWLAGPEAARRLTAAVDAISAHTGGFDVADVEALVDKAAADGGVERTPLIHTLRVAATGRTVGPGLFETLSALGRDAVLERLRRAQTWLLP